MKPNFNNYYDPHNINCPQDCVKVDRVIYDGTAQNGSEDFSLALILWKGTPTLAIRWNHTMREELDSDKKNNIKKCMGIPNSFAKPVWFVLPYAMQAAILSAISRIKNADIAAIKYAENKLNVK